MNEIFTKRSGNKNIFNKSDRLCRDVKTQKVWVTVGTKLNKPLPYNPT